MIELFEDERIKVLPLCEEYKEEVTLFACVDGHMGRMWCDKKEEPTCAVALVGDFFFILGSNNRVEENDIINILEQNHGKIILIEAKRWEPLMNQLKQKFEGSYKSYSRYAMKGRSEWFNQAKLKEYAVAIEPEFRAERIDEGIHSITQEQFWTADFCSNFQTIQDFMEHGIGYVILKEGQIISGASTYGYCEGKLEITIETKEEYRKKGLARACASKLILESLERNIFPRWDAANMTSVALAEKLGYQFDHEYTVYSI
jgi:GNAT superfamily N-acetyltransferase